MDPQTRVNYAELVHFTNLLRDLSIKEFDTTATLDTVTSHRTLNPIARDRLQAAIAEASRLNEMIQLGSRQWIENAKPLNLKIGAEDQAYLRQRAEICPMPDDPPTPK